MRKIRDINAIKTCRDMDIELEKIKAKARMMNLLNM